MPETKAFINQQKTTKKIFLKMLNENKIKMQRKDFLKRITIATAGVIVGAPLASAVINEKPKYNIDLASDIEVEAGDWSSLTVFWNGEWNRQLTDKEIMILYNYGYPLTYDEMVNKRLLPNRTFKVWRNRKSKN